MPHTSSFAGKAIHAQIPEAFHDLFDKPVVVVLATIMPDGQPQVTPVWCDLHDNQIWVNSAVGRQKDKNMRADPLVAISAIDPANPYRWLEVRGRVVEYVTGEAAVAHIDGLAQKYMNVPRYTLPAGEERCIYKIEPTRVNTSSR